MAGRKIIIGDTEYPSFRAAARELGLNYSRLLRLNSDKVNEVQLQLLDSPTPIRVHGTVEIRGTVYPSASEAARQLGVHRVTIHRHLERGTLHLVGVHGCSGQRRTLKRSKGE